MGLRIVLTSLILVCASGLAVGDVVYKWVDADGKIYFSDRPISTDSMPITLPSAQRYPHYGASDPEPGKANHGDRPGVTAQGEKPEVDPEEQKRIRGHNCDVAKKTYQRNQTITRMYRTGKGGERIYLSDKERAQVLQQSQDAIKEWCD